MSAPLWWVKANPYALLLLLMGLGIANLWRKRRESRIRLLVVTIPFVLLTLLSIPALVYVARGTLEWPYPPMVGRPEGTEAIVVLSAGVREDEAGGLGPDNRTSARCERAAELYRQGTPCLVLVSGGSAEEGQTTRAAVMRDYLVKLGVATKDIVMEDRSQDTYENAVECRQVLARRGLKRVVVVTDASHLCRAVACFRAQGVDVQGCGCRYLSTPESEERFVFWPRLEALERWRPIGYEWLGLAWYWVTGRI